jgi:hypothetical protein
VEKIFPRKDLFFSWHRTGRFCCWKKEEKKKKARKTIRAHPLDHRGMLAGTSGGFFQCALFFLFPFFRLLFSFFFIKEEVSFTTQEVKVVLL